MLAFLVFNYAVFALIFFLDRVTVRLTEPRVKERISFVRNLYHWIVSPFVLMAYSIVELYALHEVMVRGKKVCKHGAVQNPLLFYKIVGIIHTYDRVKPGNEYQIYLGDVGR